jgi:DNA-binding MarR family transcriptional regulator
MTKQTPTRGKRTRRPAGKNDTRFLDDFLLYLLARASSEASAGFHELVRKRGLSVGEWRVMFTLADGSTTVGDMAARTLMQQPTLTKLLDRMEAAGTVRRQVDPADGRRVLITLTPAGRTHNDALMPLAKAHEAALLSEFTGAEATALKAALNRLIAQAG